MQHIMGVLSMPPKRKSAVSNAFWDLAMLCLCEQTVPRRRSGVEGSEQSLDLTSQSQTTNKPSPDLMLEVVGTVRPSGACSARSRSDGWLFGMPFYTDERGMLATVFFSSIHDQ